MTAAIDRTDGITRVGSAIHLDFDRLRLDRGGLEDLAALLQQAARDPMVYALIAQGGPGVRLDPATVTFETQAEAARVAWRLECFSKPTVALIDSELAGFAGDLVQWGTHRVAGEGYRWTPCWPTTQGASLDAGVAHRLARLPNRIGVYLALTGRALRRADAFRLGIATHCVPVLRFGEIRAGLATADPVDPLLDERHVDPGCGELEPFSMVIASCFAPGDVPDIVERLSSVPVESRDWARLILEDIARTSTESLERRLHQLERASRRDVRETLIDGVHLGGRVDATFSLPSRREMQSLRTA